MKKFTLFACLLLSIFAKAQDGFPDPSFNNGSYVATILTEPIFSSQNSPFVGLTPWPTFTAFEKSGRLTIAKSHRSSLFITRYDNNGMLDQSFNGGVVVQSFFQPYYLFQLQGIAVQSDGKVVLAAFARSGPNDIIGNKMLLIRYTSSGILDNSFGNNGVREIVSEFNRSSVRKMGIRNDGSIVLLEQLSTALGITTHDIVINIFNQNGTRIGGGHAFFTPRDLPILSTLVSALHLQEDGKIIVGALGSPAPPNFFSILQRHDADGSPDASFGQGGVVINVSLGGIPQAIASQSDGKIIVAVADRLFRFKVNGTRDSTFGRNGMLQSPFPALSILVQADGKIITAGTYNAPGAHGHFLLARYDPNTSAFDPSFGYGGMSVIGLTPKTVDVEALTIANNRIYVYGGGFIAAFQTSSGPLSANPGSGVQSRPIGEKIKEQSLNVLVLPNPATTHFVLRLQGNSNKPIQIRVYDAVGRTIELKRNVTPGNTLRLGDSYRPGIYYAEVVQGSEKKTIKLIKGSR